MVNKNLLVKQMVCVKEINMQTGVDLNEMIIRPIEAGDAENLSALAIYVWLHTYANSGIRNKLSEFVLKEFTPQKFAVLNTAVNEVAYVAVDDGHVVGFITIDLASRHNGTEIYGFEIRTLYVHPFFQKNGIGKALVKHIQKECGATYWLTTWVHNASAIRFYMHMGFEKVGTTEFNLSGELHENLVLSNVDIL